MTLSPLPKKWVLIVEDDEDITNLLAEELRKEGYSILHSGNTLDAYRLLNNQKFECILLDMHLERGAGDQIVSFIRRDKMGFNFETPIVVISGELSTELVQKIMNQVEGFFVKPFKLNAVVEKIKSLSGTPRAREIPT